MIFTKENASEWFDYWYDHWQKKKPDCLYQTVNQFDSDGITMRNPLNTISGPEWVGLRCRDHKNRTASLIVPYTGKLLPNETNVKVYMFFSSGYGSRPTSDVSFEKWLRLPEVAEYRLGKIIGEVLSE